MVDCMNPSRKRGAGEKADSKRRRRGAGRAGIRRRRRPPRGSACISCRNRRGTVRCALPSAGPADTSGPAPGPPRRRAGGACRGHRAPAGRRPGEARQRTAPRLPRAQVLSLFAGAGACSTGCSAAENCARHSMTVTCRATMPSISVNMSKASRLYSCLGFRCA